MYVCRSVTCVCPESAWPLHVCALSLQWSLRCSKRASAVSDGGDSLETAHREMLSLCVPPWVRYWCHHSCVCLLQPTHIDYTSSRTYIIVQKCISKYLMNGTVILYVPKDYYRFMWVCVLLCYLTPWWCPWVCLRVCVIKRNKVILYYPLLCSISLNRQSIEWQNVWITADTQAQQNNVTLWLWLHPVSTSGSIWLSVTLVTLHRLVIFPSVASFLSISWNSFCSQTATIVSLGLSFSGGDVSFQTGSPGGTLRPFLKSQINTPLWEWNHQVTAPQSHFISLLTTALFWNRLHHLRINIVDYLPLDNARRDETSAALSLMYHFHNGCSCSVHSQKPQMTVCVVMFIK